MDWQGMEWKGLERSGPEWQAWFAKARRGKVWHDVDPLADAEAKAAKEAAKDQDVHTSVQQHWWEEEGVGWSRVLQVGWQRGFLWQLVTFEFVGTGREPDLWFLVSLLILFMFGRDLIVRLGAKDFWRFLVLASAFAGVIAVAVQLLIVAFGFTSFGTVPFILMQGQHILLAIKL